MKHCKIFIFIITTVVFCTMSSSGSPIAVYFYDELQDPRCNNDSECRDSETCHNNICIDPCILMQDPMIVMRKCGENAKCLSKNHTFVCECPSTHRGNPDYHCYQQTDIFHEQKKPS